MTPPSSQMFGVGIIGFGFVGKVHPFDCQSLAFDYDPRPVRTKLVGVAERTVESAKRAAIQAGFEFGTADWRELMVRDDIHIIDICSPNSLHAEQLTAAMAAGKHLYCDKPLVSGEESMAKIEASLRAKQLLDEGFVGKVVSFRGAHLHSGSVDHLKPVGWKQLRSQAGGVIQDMAPHIVDMMDCLIGSLTSVYAQTQILYPQRPNGKGEMVPVEAEDLVVMMAKLGNGTVGVIETSKIATGAEDELRFEIHGDKVRCVSTVWDANYLDAYDLRNSDAPLGGRRGWQRIACVQRYEAPAGFPGPKFSVGWIRAHLHSLYSFLRAVAGGSPAEPSWWDGLRLQHMLAAAERSADTQTWQSLPDRIAHS